MTDYPPIACMGVTPTFGNNFDRFIARGIQYFTATRDEYSKGSWVNARVNHAVIYVGEIEGFDKPQNVEAAPGGAHFADWDNYGDDMIWLPEILQAQKDIPRSQWPLLDITDAQRQAARDFAVDCAIKDIGYNYLDFLAIALAQRRMHSLVSYEHPPWWARRINDEIPPIRYICSQLDDAAWTHAGVNPFADNRLPGLVSPNDILMLSPNIQ